jgi:hypothetical protein
MGTVTFWLTVVASKLSLRGSCGSILVGTRTAAAHVTKLFVRFRCIQIKVRNRFLKNNEKRNNKHTSTTP